MVSVSRVLLVLMVFSVSAADAQQPPPKVPDQSRQAEIQRRLHQALEISAARSRKDKEKLLSQLIDLAKKSKQTPDDFYVILREAFPLIYEVDGFENLLSTHELLASVFPQFEQKAPQFAFAFLEKTAWPDEATQAVEYLMPHLREQVLDNQFDQSRRQLTTMLRALRRLDMDDAAEQAIQNRSLIADRKKAHAAWKKAEQTLAANDMDPEANQDAGIWLAVFESDWERALPLLAKGPKGSLRAAAAAEIASASGTLENAQSWVQAAADQNGVASKAIRQHAQAVYSRINQEELTPLSQVVLAKQTGELNNLVKQDGDAWTLVASDLPYRQKFPQGGRAPKIDRANGKTIDLLAMVDPAQHAIVGNWERRGSDLVGLSHRVRRFMAPYAVSGSYQLSMNFTRNTGIHDIALILPVGHTRVDLILSAYDNTLSGLGRVHGKWIADRKNPRTGFRKGPSIITGKRHVLGTRVLVSSATASIDVTLDGSPFLTWEGPISELSGRPISEMVLTNTPGVYSLHDQLTVHKLDLTLLTRGQGQRLEDDWGTPFTEVRDRPAPTVARSALEWNGKYYFISPKPVSLAEAKQLAIQLNGRLLTTSSDEEHQAIQKLRGNRFLWMSGWRSETSNTWRDERNRPLRFLDGWIAGVEPGNQGGVQRFMRYRNMKRGFGWGDIDSYTSRDTHACIEWGEEYPSE